MDPPFAPKTCEGYVTALDAHRKSMIEQGLAVASESSPPWQLQTVKDLLATKAMQWKAKRKGPEAILTNRNKRQMNADSLLDAMTASLQRGKFSMPMRFSMSFQVATGARMDDILVLLLRDLHLHPFDHGQPGEIDFAGTWVGADRSHAISFNTLDRKHMQPGQVGNRSVVRYRHLEICPLSALADLLISMLSRPGALCAEFLRSRHILIAPNSSGEKPMAYNSIRKQYKEILLSVGVDVEAVVLQGDKPEVTHLLKKLAVSLLKMQGLAFSDISRAAGHAHNVTDDSYSFTTDAEVMHRMANFGAQWRTEHVLGRGTIQPDASLETLALVGFDQLAENLAGDKQLESVLEVIRFLRTAWLQDAALKVDSLGAAWTQHFPQLQRILASAAWPAFAAKVRQAHADSLRRAEEAKCAPATNGQLAAQLKAQIKAEMEVAYERQEARLHAEHAARMAQVAQLIEALRTPHGIGMLPPVVKVEGPHAAQGIKCRPEQPDQPPTKRQRAEKEGQALHTFALNNFQTVASAYAAYMAILSAKEQHGGQLWRTSPGADHKQAGQERTRQAQAFSEFGKGTVTEIAKRGVDDLDRERLTNPAFNKAGRHTSLQKIVSHYLKIHRPNSGARR